MKALLNKTILPLFSFHSGNLQTGTLANSADPDGMSHNAAFQQGCTNVIIFDDRNILKFKNSDT